MLNSKRRLEKMAHLFGKMPLPLYLEKTKKLYEEFKKSKLYYSALRVGLMRAVALEWKLSPHEHLQLIKELKEFIKIDPDSKSEKDILRGSYLLFNSRFILLTSEASAYSILRDIKKASHLLKVCDRMLHNRKHVSPYLVFDMGVMYSNLQNFKKAEKCFLNAVNRVGESTKKSNNALSCHAISQKGRV